MESLRGPTNNRVCLILILALMYCIGICGEASGSLQNVQRNVRGIEDDDISTIKRVGDSGDRRYIPYLRKVLVHRGTTIPFTSSEEEAFIALIKLGDRDQMSYLECELLGDPGTAAHLGVDILPRVKGWFAIREYYLMLGLDRAYVAGGQKDETDIPGGVPPSYLAVKYLPTVIPNPPFPSISHYSDPRIKEFARRWKSWILRHRARLEQLRPVGQKGVAFSSAGCPIAKP